ncbi:hypothetical protein ALC57_00385 [Trachymyrmex cornetzi]|uniref:C2H2-type domain-containing protein n=1 Tax=Trachymyrmex cornetzi TaxID=471704 RepID=A0A151JS08_9HYME|nr:hypothetical protein ALC57_00385 [Trachymyrmex cornetzi]
MPSCFICGIELYTINQLHRHFKLIHKLDDNHNVFKCAEVACYQQCSNWTVFRRYLNKFHIFATQNSSVPLEVISSSFPLSNDESVHKIPFNYSNVPFYDNSYVSNEFNKDENFSLSTHDFHSKFPINQFFFKDVIRTHVSTLIGKLNSQPSSRKMVQNYIEDTTDFLCTVVSLLCTDITTILHDQNVNSNIVDKICSKLGVLKNPFEGLHSEYLRLKFLKKLGFYTAPKEYIIASDMFTKKVNGKVLINTDNVKGQYIPLRKFLKIFLELPNVLNVIMNALRKSSCEDTADRINYGNKRIFNILITELKQQLCAYRFMIQKNLDTMLEVGSEEKSNYYNTIYLPENFSNGNFMQHVSVTFKGTLYHTGMCVAIGVDDDGGPEFGIISSILVNLDGNICFICSVLSCIMYSEHYHAYNVTNTTKTISIIITDLLDYLLLLFCRCCDEKQYVTLHHLL